MKHRYLLVLLGLFIMAGADQPGELKENDCKLVKQTVQEDLNFDKKAETITLIAPDGYCSRGNPTAQLIIDGDSVSGNSEGASRLEFFDIYRGDLIKEVAVHCDGPSGVDEYAIYWFDGKKIHERGFIGGWSPIFPGDGTVYISEWHESFTIRQKYVLNQKTGELEKVPQTYYEADVDYTTAEDEKIILYETPEFKRQVEVIPPGSKCRVLIYKENPPCGSINCPAYLVRSQTGIVGWAKKVNLPVAN